MSISFSSSSASFAFGFPFSGQGKKVGTLTKIMESLRGVVQGRGVPSAGLYERRDRLVKKCHSNQEDNNFLEFPTKRRSVFFRILRVLWFPKPEGFVYVSK